MAGEKWVDDLLPFSTIVWVFDGTSNPPIRKVKLDPMNYGVLISDKWKDDPDAG